MLALLVPAVIAAVAVVVALNMSTKIHLQQRYDSSSRTETALVEADARQ